jgi:Ca2+-transporting ATPase
MVNDVPNARVAANICINSTADIVDGVFIGNPTECALLAKVGEYKKIRESADVVKVIPFSSEEKMMTTVVRVNGAEITYVKGSPEKIMALCNNFSAEGEIRSHQEKACRIIAFAHHDGEYPADKFCWDGFAAITDPLRADVFDAVRDCRSAGIALKILTGDNLVTAKAIGEELRILSDENAKTTEAKELEDLSDDELTAMLPQIRIIARSTPTIKMRVVKLLKAEGHVVAVTGDGINDAPAIKNADVGIAMGITGTEVSKEAADIVLLDDSFATIAKAVKWGRSIYENFQRFIAYQLTVNLSTVIVVLAAIILGFGAPFTALQLLWINIIMDGPPAIALGLEPIPKKSELMKRRPIKRTDPIITRAMVARIMTMSVFIVGVVLSQRMFDFLGAADLPRFNMFLSDRSDATSPTAEAYQRTVFFALFATFKLFNALNSRELGTTSMFKNFFANRLVLGAVGIAFVAQVMIIQYGGAFFRTVPLPVDMWLKIFAVGSSVIVVSELLRLIMKAVNRSRVPLEP